MVAGDLGEQLIGCNANGRSQLPLRQEFAASTRWPAAGLEQRGIGVLRLTEARQVQVGLINGHLFQHRSGRGDEFA